MKVLWVNATTLGMEMHTLMNYKTVLQMHFFGHLIASIRFLLFNIKCKVYVIFVIISQVNDFCYYYSILWSNM